MQLYYASRDGQSRRIAERIAGRLAETGITVCLANLAECAPGPADLTGPAVVVVAAVRYGRHLPEAVRLLARYAGHTSAAPLILLSVNLTARKPGKTTAEGNAYLRAAIRRHKLQPAIAGAIAGRLDYPRYHWFDRMMIRFIMLLTGGPTDPSVQVEFTDWNQVEELAHRIAEFCANSNRIT